MTKNSLTKRRKNYLRCPDCGFGVISESDARHCARCSTEIFIEKKTNGK